MTETGDESASGDVDPDDGDDGGPNPGLERVVDALAPFIEQADTLAGFSVKYADARSASEVKDRSTVEVRFDLGQRDPMDLDRARGMLQGHGFDPEKKYRGGSASVVTYLSVPVAEREDEDPEWDTPTDAGEQVTF